MRQETKEALYIGAIVVCSFAFFRLGQIVDNRCATEIQSRNSRLIDSEEKAAIAKLEFCINNRPQLDDIQQVTDKFELFKRIHCPERLLYSDCDKSCREDLVFDIKIDMSSWDSYKNNDVVHDLPLPNEDVYPEP